MNQTPDSPKTAPTTYHLHLCFPDGSRFATIPEARGNPRYIHLIDEVLELSDSETPDTPGVHIDTFARLVCVHVDDDRDTLYIRTDGAKP